MIEQPHRIPASVASCGGNLVKQDSFLGNGSLLVARDHLSDQLALGLKTHHRFHVSSLKKRLHTILLQNRPSNHACLKSLLPLLFQRTAYYDASRGGEKANPKRLDKTIVFCERERVSGLQRQFLDEAMRIARQVFPKNEGRCPLNAL